jgi:hypothetical protein
MLRVSGNKFLSESSRLQSRTARSRSLVVRPVAFFEKLFGGGKPSKQQAAKRIVRPTIIPEPSFNLPISLMVRLMSQPIPETFLTLSLHFIVQGIGALEIGLEAPAIGAFTTILGAFLAFQATRVRFVFDDEGLEVVVGASDPKQTDNAFVGGKNRWSYESFVNWEFWWPGFPCLVYFKETQTRPEGQIHFFPIIFEGKELYNVMLERCGPSKGSSPSARAAAAQFELDTYQTPDERDD